MITLEQLKTIMPLAKERAERFLPHLKDAMQVFKIDETVKRMSAFLAQVAHESCSLQFTEEIASGKAYEGREDLGNTEFGDGRKFKGHGLIQLTGRANHQEYADYRSISIEEVLRYLQTPAGATNVAGWFWNKKHLNELADADNFRKITRIINGGYNGYADRVKFYKRALLVLE